MRYTNPCSAQLNKMPTPAYPRCKEFGLPITEAHGIAVVTPADLVKVFPKGSKKARQFSAFYGIQTSLVEGLYAWDVESVLERMVTGKLTGTQLDWD